MRALFPVRIPLRPAPWLVLLGLYALLACGPESAPGDTRSAAGTSDPSRPHLLMILADDLGYGDLGRLGGAARTPHLDRLASESARFTNFYAGAPVCSPSRASLLTGLAAPFTGVRQPIQSKRPGNRLRTDVELLPQRLREVGYRTALVGKWHLGWESPDLPGDRGFDEFLGFLSQSRYRTERLLENGSMRPMTGNVTELITERACALLEQAARDEQPLCLIVSHLAPHAPIEEAASFLGERVAEQQAAGVPRPEAMYRAVIEHLDEQVDELLATLERLGLAESTVVVFASDNGPEAGSAGPFRGGKWGLYEGGLRVPLTIRWPGHTGASDVDALTTMPDLYPTLLAAAGAAVPTENGGTPLTGRSLLSLVGDPAAPIDTERALAWRHGPTEALRRGAWKLLRARDGSRVELYDLTRDPGETSNLAAQRPKVVEELQAELTRLLQGA